ncbi:MAG: KpsF/GutQ family sugar-phosphate isomerase [Castellaniella sp.]
MMTPSPVQPDAVLASVKRTFDIEIAGLCALRERLGEALVRAVDLILASRGRVVVTGLGKSGHIARKIAATLASTGTPSFFMHAAEAVHGDLGMLTRDDLVVAISYSGSGAELLTIVSIAKRLGTPLIAFTGNTRSELALAADIHLDVHVAHEACPLDLAPTASTTACLVLGDALAVACLEARGFSREDFALSHPGGALGRRLLTRVRDVMRQGDDLPVVGADTLVPDALAEMSAKSMGMTIVTGSAGEALGIFTDGDLRRLIAGEGDIRRIPVSRGMTAHPRSVPPDTMALEAAQLMDSHRINQIVVTDDQGRLLGALHMHDLLAAKVI